MEQITLLNSEKLKNRFENERMISIKKILTPLLLLLTFNSYRASTSIQFKLIRGNGDTYFSEDVYRNEDLEYPRKDARILHALHAMWKNYYMCLQEKEKQETKPEIRHIVAGQNTEFKCDICPRPFQNYEEIEWKFKPLSPEANSTDLEYLDLTPEMTLTVNKTLQIFNAMESITGLYVCYHKKNVLSVYVLEVSKNDTIKKVDTQQIKEEYFNKLEHDILVHYQWTDYTECSTCGKVGRKFKYGTCYVSSKPTSPNNERNSYKVNARGSLKISENFPKTKQHLSKKSFIKQKTRSLVCSDNSTSQVSEQNFGQEIIEKFLNGIPCASPYLSKTGFSFLENYTAIKVIVKYCWEPCQENKIFEVLESSGKVVEIANNSAGIYSLFQKLPKIPPGIERKSLVAEFGTSIIIQCPGTLLINTPFVWKVNKKIIYPEIISNKSNGRFTIDLINRIHIQKLRLKDSQIFSCWQKEKLVGTVHLNVEKKFKIDFNHHITLLGIITIIGTLVMVGSKILTRELKMRKK